MNTSIKSSFIRWFSEIKKDDVALVGGKTAALGELYSELTKKGVNVPNGFAITVAAFEQHLRTNELEGPIQDLMVSINPKNIDDLKIKSSKIRDMIRQAPLPHQIEREILSAYSILSRDDHHLLDVAVRSSATAEDLPEASFAGQQESFLNIHGKAALIEASKRCFASLYTDRAISYRHHIGFGDKRIGLSVAVQKMVRSDLASAGVMFTLDTESGSSDVVLISAAWGLGETVVQGSVNPDEYYVFKPTLLKGKKPIFQKKMGSKEIKAIYGSGANTVKIVSVPFADRERFALDEDDILQLAHWGCIIEGHMSSGKKTITPLDIEWAKDGKTGELFILQARPETVHSQRNHNIYEFQQIVPEVLSEAKVLVSGRAVGERIGSGRARVVRDISEIGRLKPGDVLVTSKTDPDWEPYMRLASALVTDHGSRTCHAAIVSRELGIPAIVGSERGMAKIPDNTPITVNCSEGETGFVYEGILETTKEHFLLDSLKTSYTDVMINLGNPDEALRLGRLPSDGVGLARMEFIIANKIKIHPMALIDFDTLQNRHEKAKIAALTFGYVDKTKFFIDHLAEGIATIAAAFWPRPVILRFSDFKSNEYANLIGGEVYEPKEENPMLGFRGAARYYDSRYRKGFALECAAVMKVREVMGLENLKVMVPFCRSPEEGRLVVEEMKKNGLERGKNALEIYCMCELPVNALLADEFLDVFDGFSIGSNDLTQLTLGVDRDSDAVQSLFDERSPAVRRLIELAIDAARRKGKKIGICGQAPSDYPEFLETLIQLGIDSISLNPDALIKGRKLVAKMEETAGDR